MIIKDTVDVTCIDSGGNDSSIAGAAWVSTQTESTPERMQGLLNYLMKHRHGTPFEAGYLAFDIHCPIFVAREWHRHRIGWSYNEMSGRYTELEPIFWVPKPGRGMVNTGTSARPKLEEWEKLREEASDDMIYVYQEAWEHYQRMLEAGVAKEVARTVLPVGTYTRFQARCNPRSLMHFLSLRTHDESAHFVSYPQAEIEEAALQMEQYLASFFPMTYSAFLKHGRVSP